MGLLVLVVYSYQFNLSLMMENHYFTQCLTCLIAEYVNHFSTLRKMSMKHNPINKPLALNS